MKAPIIGIPCVSHNMGYILNTYGINAHYMEQVRAGGAIPVELPIFGGREDADALMAICDGFLLPGGGDFDPDFYGEELLPGLEQDPTSMDRASQEACMTFIRKVVTSGKPVLGICLGMQLINVAMGGSLYQDIPTQYPSEVPHRNPMEKTEDRWHLAHNVTLAPESLIGRLSGKEEIPVNSFHHQGVKTLALGFTATAWAADGLAEAIEDASGKVLGVQWHPENLSHAGMPEAQAIFRWLAEQAVEA